MADVIVYHCKHIGVVCTTPTHVLKLKDGSYLARVGFAIMGNVNMTDEEFVACDFNPFHEQFQDNFAQGAGATEEEATVEMDKDLALMAQSLWL